MIDNFSFFLGALVATLSIGLTMLIYEIYLLIRKIIAARKTNHGEHKRDPHSAIYRKERLS